MSQKLLGPPHPPLSKHFPDTFMLKSLVSDLLASRIQHEAQDMNYDPVLSKMEDKQQVFYECSVYSASQSDPQSCFKNTAAKGGSIKQGS